MWTGPNLQTRPLCHPEMLKDTRCWVFKQVLLPSLQDIGQLRTIYNELLLLTET